MEAIIFGLVGVVTFGAVNMLLSYPAFGLSYIEGKLIAIGVTLIVLGIVIFFIWLFVWRHGNKEGRQNG